MMARTDRHFRYLLRLLSRRVMLYTEMLATGALLHGDAERHLRFHPLEHPVGAQLGGGDPDELAACARLVEARGYDEVNLNLGCPSDRVKSGRFGACLMAEPERVAECARAMTEAVALPVTVKTRTGIDHLDSYERLAGFVATVAAGGCRVFIIHARKAWLQGLSPKENRTLPPLQYELVYRLKQDFPDLEIIINGGIKSLEQAQRHLQRVDGAMLGRAVCDDPGLLAGVDKTLFNVDNEALSRRELLENYLLYMEEELAQSGGGSLRAMLRPLLGLYRGQPRARAYRRCLSEQGDKKNAGAEVVRQALALLEP